jgi:hypothetical protein
MANKLPAQICYETSNLAGGGSFESDQVLLNAHGSPVHVARSSAHLRLPRNHELGKGAGSGFRRDWGRRGVALAQSMPKPA